MREKAPEISRTTRKNQKQRSHEFKGLQNRRLKYGEKEIGD